MQYSLLQNVKIIVGAGKISLVGEALKEAGYKKAFIVFDKGVKAVGIIDKVINSLEKSAIDYIEYDNVLPDPPCDIVNEGGKICIKEKCDCVIAVGGGSAIDTGKGINILRVNGGNDILDYSNPEKEMKKCLGLMSISTTSGTGSELSNGLIISDTKNNKKVAILAGKAMSEFAVIDSQLSSGMPKGLTIMTGLDVFSHAAEGYTSILADGMTDIICEKIMETVATYLPRAAENGNDMIAREKMHVAASLGGWMLANSSAHVGHSIAHVIGGKYHIPHGACCAYSLPVVMKFISEEYSLKIKKIGEILGVKFNGNESSKEIASKSVNAYVKFRDEILKLKKLSEFKIDDVNYDILADDIINEPLACLCIRKVDKEAAKNMIKEIFI